MPPRKTKKGTASGEEQSEVDPSQLPEETKANDQKTKKAAAPKAKKAKSAKKKTTKKADSDSESDEGGDFGDSDLEAMALEEALMSFTSKNQGTKRVKLNADA